MAACFYWWFCDFVSSWTRVPISFGAESRVFSFAGEKAQSFFGVNFALEYAGIVISGAGSGDELGDGGGVEPFLRITEGCPVMIIEDDIFNFAGDGGGFKFGGSLSQGSFDNFPLIFPDTFVPTFVWVHK